MYDDESIPTLSKRSPIHNLNCKATLACTLSTKAPWYPPTARPKPVGRSTIVRDIGPARPPKVPPPAWMLAEAAKPVESNHDYSLPPPPDPPPPPAVGNHSSSLPPPPLPPPSQRYGPAGRGGYASKRLVSGGALPGPIGPKPPTSPPTAKVYKVYKQLVDELNAKPEEESLQQRKSLFQLELKFSRTED